MKIQQKKFILGSESGKDLKKSDVLILVVNGVNRPDIPLSRVFKKLKIEKSSVEGWSILSIFSISDRRLVHENVTINFFNQSQNEEIAILKIQNPLFQMGDKAFLSAEVREFEEMLTQKKIENDLTSQTDTNEVEDQVKILESLGYKKEIVGEDLVFLSPPTDNTAGLHPYLIRANVSVPYQMNADGVPIPT